MIQLFSTVPDLIIGGCLFLLLATTLITLMLRLRSARILRYVDKLSAEISLFGPIERPIRHQGLPLSKLEELRSRAESLEGPPLEWWDHINGNIEGYTSPEDKDGWFLTDRPRNILPYEIVVGRHLHAAFFGAVPGLLTGFGLMLTFVAILLALYGVHYNKANAADPISGIDVLINGLSGKFLSSIVALLLSIVFTLYEKQTIRKLRAGYEKLITCFSDAIPYLSSSRILLDIQRFSSKQTVSISNISSEVVDRFMGAFNSQVAPSLAIGMSSGVADKLQAEFRPTMERMSSTLDNLQSAIVRLEEQKQESVTSEIRTLLESLENSMVQALSKIGDQFHQALTGAASEEFGSLAGTLESTRQMLSEMNMQFSTMQATFSAVVQKAEQTTSDQLKSGKEQTEALIALMNGLMLKLQESADQNLNTVRTQLTSVVSDLAERVGTLSNDMMAAATSVAKDSQASANEVLQRTGDWSEATARRLESLFSSIEARSIDFQKAGSALLEARAFVTSTIAENAKALDRMAEASRQVQAYSSGLAGQTDALKSIGQQHASITNQLKDVSGSIRLSADQNEKLLAEYRKAFQDYRSVIDTLDVSLTKILGAIQGGMRDYSQSVENNFREIVGISNKVVPEIASLLKTQVEELSGQFEELSSVISRVTDRTNGRNK